MSPFRPIDRKPRYLLPPSVEAWLPEDPLARFIVEVVEGLDGSRLERASRGRGSAASHPALLLSLLVYGYASGVFASRRIERATSDSVALRFIAAGSHPDPETLAACRRRFLDALADLLVPVRALAKEMKLLKLGPLRLDGTQVHANASRHRALAHGSSETIEPHLKAEVPEGLALAEQAERADVPDGVRLPDASKRREDRLTARAPAQAKLEARAQERVEREQAAYEAKLGRREAQAQDSGKKPPGQPPPPPAPGVQATEQINLTDEESRIMPVSGGGFEQAYNAQAAVASGSLLVVVPAVTQAPNAQAPMVPMLAQLAALPAVLGEVDQRRAATGFCSARNVAACEAAGIEPLSAVARDEHPAGWRARFTEPAPLPEGASAGHRMAHRRKPARGRAADALRKQTVEPVFGIITSVLGFRQLLLRGLVKVSGEWRLVCLAWNLKRRAAGRLQT